MNKDKTVLIIFGPTASGKTKLAVEVAKAVGGDIVSVDSQQVYKELMIGTARPTIEEMSGVIHHLIGHVSVRDRYNVSRYLTDAEDVIQEILQSKRLPIVTGGTYMWIASMVDGFSPTPPADLKLRANLEERADSDGLDCLYEELKELDPQSAEKISPADRRRIIRSLEIITITGRPRSEVFREKIILPFDFLKVGITRPRQDLYRRINLRVDEMIENGLLEEIEMIIKDGLEPYVRDVMAHGYPALLDHLHGICTLDFALERMKTDTRRYAKRQLSFLSGREDFTVFNSPTTDDILEYLDTQGYQKRT